MNNIIAALLVVSLIGISQAKPVKHSRKNLDKKTRVLKPGVSKSTPIDVVIFEPTMEAYSLIHKSHKNYKSFIAKFKEKINSFLDGLPHCSGKHNLRRCVHNLFAIQQWIDAFLQHKKVQKCKVKTELVMLNKLLISKVMAAATYSPEIIKKMEQASPEYYQEVEKQIGKVTKDLPSCF